jgi:PKD-like domain/Secretion system C-terminal sorting domain/Putative metal-binding motif
MRNFTKLLNQIRETHSGILTLLFCLTSMLFATSSSAQIALRGSATTSTSTNTNITINKPTGVVSGDLLLVNIAKEGNNSTAPSLTGWTLIDGRTLAGGTQRYGAVLYKVAGASEPVNYAFALGTGTTSASAGIVAFSGVDTAGGIFDVASGLISVSANGTTAVSALTKTTVTANTAIVMFGQAAASNPSWSSWSTTSPGALTELFDITQGSGASGSSAGAAWALKPTAGATGNGAATLSVAERNGGILIALKKLCPPPTITTTGTATAVCFSASAQTTSMPYTATTNSPTSYTINWDTAANTAGFVDQGSTAHTFVSGVGSMPNIAIPASIVAGTYNGTITITNAGGCTNTQALSVTINPSPTANAGGALTAICQGGISATLGGSVGGSATGGTWSSSVAGGVFTPSATTLNATWAPPSGYSGTAVLTLTTSGGACGTTTAFKNLVVNGQPTATAGGTQTICVNGTATVSGASSSNGTIAWTENGAGSITSGATTLTPVYTPAAGDAGNTVTLTMTVTNSPCTVATATYTVVVKALPTATAGGTQTICLNGTATVSGATSSNGTILWSHNGAGSITSGATTLTPVYTPAAGDAGTTVTLTMTVTNSPCVVATATYTVVVRALPTATAGGTQTICVGSTATVSGASSSNGTIAWTENGAGSITAGATTLTPTYTSAAGDSGNTVTLTMTVTNSPCTAATATYTVVVNPLATVNANVDQTICATTANATLAGSIGGSASSATWSGGTGTFSPNNTTLNATYTPSAAEFLAGGNVTLTLTTNDPAGPCNAVSDTMIITIKLSPIAIAGGTQTICPGLAAVVSGASSSNGTISWTEDGAGSITAGGTTLTPTYTSSAADAGNTVTLTMTVTNSPCSVATATYTVVVSPATPAAPGTITGSTSVCAGVTSLNYSIVAVTNATNYIWTVPSGWSITAGLGTTSITATAGAAGTGDITVVASNSCGSTNPTSVINISPVNGTNNTGFVTSTVKTNDGIQCNNLITERRGFVKFPLTAIPTGATIVSSSLRLINNASLTLSTANNDVKPLGNTDPVAGTSTASVLFNAIGAQNSGANYSRTTWSNTGTITLALNATATTDIQSRFASPGYIAMGLARGSFSVYNFFGYSSGTNAPRLDVTYTAPRSLSITVNPLTTIGSLTTSACDSYTWSENSQTYTSSGVYTNVVGCNTATLNLTITPSTTVGSLTTSACDSYTWALNSQTYTTSGVYTHVVGCNTATLNLTITPSTTVGSLTATACDSYTWALNSQTYTSSGIYTHVIGCNTATLNLTITPSTTVGSLTTSACDSYTWALNSQTYTSSGIYTHVVGCNTATLNLTIIPSTTVGSLTASACDSYTWALNSQTYTSSGIYTHVVGCNTATLTLTIIPSTTVGSLTTSACDTYTWSENAQTYTSSGIYTHVVGCNTATLDLTIIPSTTVGSQTVNACISYTWAENGLTYTSSGIYTHVVGCNTATLTLTVNTTPLTFYADTDGDGFGAGAAILSCTGQPANTSTNNTDCAPGDASKWRTANFFVDADSDGFNNGFPATSQCYGATTPSGFVAVNNGVDCNDNNASVNPNASEVLGNGIDDNCDGTIDEVTPMSNLIASSCGITLTNLANTLFAYDLATFIPQLGPIQGYRFRVSNGTTVRTYDSPTVGFSLMNLQGGATYATTYSVEVSVKSGGFYRAYGSPCSITTPAIPNATFVVNPISGSTLTDINQSIFCNRVPTASGYRFRVKNGATLVGTYSTSINRFSLVNLGISNIEFGTTYTVDVLLKFGSDWRSETEYGPTAEITSPATPGTSRVIQPTCGSTINALWTTIYAQQVVGAQGYKFVVTNGAQTREYPTANPRFQLPLLSGGALANTAYTIRVDVLYNSSYVEGDILCTISTSSTATRQSNTVVDIYDVNAYPNPYADTFKLNINTSNENQVEVKVYDMLGRMVEVRQSNVSDVTNLEIGSQYPSGVYNVVVSQGNQTKTLRVIKR